MFAEIIEEIRDNTGSDDDEVELIKVERPKSDQNSQKEALQSIIYRLKASKSTATSQQETKSDPLTIQKYFPCTKCKKILVTAVDLVQHSKQHEKKRALKPLKHRFSCKICPSEFEKQVSLAAHMNLHRFSTLKEDFQHKCKECSETFRSNGSLWNHRKLKHMVDVHKCGICCKTFATEVAYNDHRRKHEAQGPIICDICQKSFTLHSSLAIHMRLHTGQLPFLCAQCGKSFNTNNRLQEHLRRHEGDRRYECNVCSKRFYEKTDLRKHEFTHSGEQKPHTCYYCGKGFILTSSLQIHIRTHTGERPYECEFKDVCQKRFVTRSQMKRHLKVHSGAFLDRGRTGS